MPLPIINDLRAVFGANPNMDINTAASVPYTKTLLTGPGEVSLMALHASAQGTATFSLIDATASGTADTVKWQVQIIPTIPIVQQFTRPLYFSKGIQITYSATAAITVTSHVQWNPLRPLDSPFGQR